MNYNKRINLLKRWCIEKSNHYSKHQKEQGFADIRYAATNELIFKLSMLIDKKFVNDADFQKQIENMLDIHVNSLLANPYNNTLKYMIEKINKEFLTYFQEIMFGDSDESISEIPYERVITGKEANEIIAQFNDYWCYDNKAYWFPLMGNEPESVQDKFFVMEKHFVAYRKKIYDWINSQEEHIYSYGESTYNIRFCVETSSLDENLAQEWAYTNKGFTWFVYFSHEGTVSFAGTIVPIVKEILEDKKEHWDSFELS